MMCARRGHSNISHLHFSFLISHFSFRRFSHFSFLISLFSFILLQEVHAQTVQLGLRGGADLTEMQFSGEALNATNRAGYFLGPVLRIKTPVVGLTVDVAGLYDQRDMRVEGTTLKQKTLQIPANARLGVDLFGVVGAFLCVGPQLSFNMGESTFYWEDLKGYRNHFTLQETTVSLNLGGGATLGKHLEGAVYYNIPMGKTADLTWDTIVNALEDQTMHRARSKMNAWRIAFTYYF